MKNGLIWLRDSLSLLDVPDAVALLRASGLEPVTSVDHEERGRVVGVIAGLQPFGLAEAALLPVLRTVARFGAGYDNVDVAALHGRGVSVSYTPDVSTGDVAHFAFAMLILALRGVPRDAAALRTVSSPWRVVGRGIDIGAATVGIIGCGHIGLKMAELVAPLAARTLLWNHRARPLALSSAASARCKLTTNLDELAAHCDAVSVHVALTPQTRGLLGSRFFNQVAAAGRQMALVNTARGDIVDEAALQVALDAGIVRDAAIDGWSTEGGAPSEAVRALRHHPAVLPSSHIGAFTQGVLERCALQCAANLVGALGLRTQTSFFIASPPGAA